MARTYWVRGPTSIAEGEPLDAHTARVLLQGNVESVYEEARYDYNVILQAAEDGSSSWYCGPIPVICRRDRSGLYRIPQISPLACGGSDERKLYATLTPTYYEPDISLDPTITFTVAAGATVGWITADEFALDHTWNPGRRLYTSGDDEGIIRIAWLTFFWDDTSGASAPRFSGYRIVEQVDVS